MTPPLRSALRQGGIRGCRIRRRCSLRRRHCSFPNGEPYFITLDRRLQREKRNFNTSFKKVTKTTPTLLEVFLVATNAEESGLKTPEVGSNCQSVWRCDTSGTDVGIICGKINPESILYAEPGNKWHIHIHRSDICKFSRDATARVSVCHYVLGAECDSFKHHNWKNWPGGIFFTWRSIFMQSEPDVLHHGVGTPRPGLVWTTYLMNSFFWLKENLGDKQEP